MLRFLADVNVEKRIVDFLREAGYDVLWIPDFDCEMEDRELLNLAERDQRVLITNDKDFGEFFFLQRQVKSGIILFRIEGQGTTVKITLLGTILIRYADKLFNHFVVVTRKRHPLGRLIMNAARLLQRVVTDTRVMLGKPVIKGTRLPVELIVEKVAYGATYEELRVDYPFLEADDVRAALLYAAKRLSNEEVYAA
jgi:uncharacterized protein (DUF433 family)/predicted nuclease of predicted toxin-antitoxin system